jgi:hypothetical protein
VPIPPLTDEGYLPAGLHDCTLEEVEDRFGRFQKSDRRIRLVEKLARYVEDVRKAGMALAVLIDGSFVTAKPDPGDIDLILVLRPGHNFAADLRPFEYNPLSKKRVRQNYRFDLLVAVEGSPEYEKYVALFQQVRDEPSLQKGLLRVAVT